MADRSKVAEAYAEVRADLSKLPADLVKVPSLVKRMLSTEGLNAVREILTGNVTQGLVSLVTGGYQKQAEALKEVGKQALETKKKLEELAAIEEQRASQAKGPEKDKHLANAQRYREGAARYQAKADDANDKSGSVASLGKSLGGKVALASKVAIAGVAAVAAAAAAYFATTVAAAHKATQNLKTSQLVKATGEAAGWSADKLKHMGEELRKATGASGDQIAGAQQALLKNPNIKGDQFKKALETAADLSAVLGSDLPAAAAELGSILADPISAADGALEKYGVLLDQAQQGQIRNAVASRDWAKAQELVLGHLKGFKGAAAEAGQTGVGGFEKLKNSIIEAASKIGGITGDIGAMAARVANAIDAFMELEMVQNAIQFAHELWQSMSDAITGFIDDNKDDIQKWGELITEIFQNVQDWVMDVWTAIKEAAKEVTDFILESFGSSWQEVKDIATDVLDAISLLTTNFGLTCKFVWLSIQLGAQNAWDAIRDGLAVMAAAFEASWTAVSRGAEAAWEQVKNTFSTDEAKSIAQAMQEGFQEGLESGAKKYKFGDSDAAKKLRSEIDDVTKQMSNAREEKREKRQDERDRKEKEKKKKETPDEGTKYVNTKKYTFEFTGFEELAKKIQLGLYPTEMTQLQRRGVKAAEDAANNGKEANKKLGEIKDKLNGGLAP